MVWRQLVKAIAGFDLLALLVLGEVRLANKSVGAKPSTSTVFFAWFIVMVVAFLSGSRGQTIVALIAGMLVFRDHLRRYWFVTMPLSAIGLPSIFVIFPFISFFRGSGYDLLFAVSKMSEIGLTQAEIVFDVLVTRLNYLEPIAQVIRYTTEVGFGGGAIYWNNLIGVIPRILWLSKPNISNDSQELAVQLGMVGAHDYSTSIGLQPIGEAFYELGWLGLMVAVAQGFAFAAGHKHFYKINNPVALAVYTTFGLYLLQRDGYFAVVPGLIWWAISVSSLMLLLHFLLPRPSWKSRQ